MSKLKFKVSEVKKLLKNLDPNSEITLVGDQGVYLMSLEQPSDSRVIVYAKNCNPNTDDWWEEKRYLFGADDDAFEICTVKDLNNLLAHCKTYVVVTLLKTKIKISNK